MENQVKQDLIDELFDRAVGLGPDERADFLNVACDNDSDLWMEVHKLLAAHDRAEQSTDLFATPPARQRLFLDSNQSESTVSHRQRSTWDTAPSRFATGQLLASKYRLDEAIGRGSFGTVYRGMSADHPGSPVAVKVVEGGSSRSEVLLEAKIHSTLDHPNIIRLLDYFIEDECPILVLDYANGGSVHSLLAQHRKWSPVEVHSLMWQLACALEHAHGRGIVHRDIKPANVLVNNANGSTAYLLSDFGVGRRNVGIQTRAEIAGSWAYMAPEQLRGRSTPQSDLWALGVIAYELVTGERPFAVTSLPELRSAIQLESPRKLPESSDRLDQGVAELILLLLQKELTARTASATELKLQLSELVVPPSDLSPSSGTTKIRRRTSTTLRDRARRSLFASGAALLLPAAVYVSVFGLFASVMYVTGLSLLSAISRWNQWREFAVACGLLLCFAAAVVFHADWDLSLLSEKTLHSMGMVPAGMDDILATKLVSVLGGLVLVASSLLLGWLWMRVQGLSHDLRKLSIFDPQSDASVTDLLTRQLEVDPRDLGARIALARSWLAGGNPGEASVQAKLVLDRDPYNYEATLLLVTALSSLEQDEPLSQLCNRYLNANPHCFELRELQSAIVKRSPSAN